MEVAVEIATDVLSPGKIKGGAEEYGEARVRNLEGLDSGGIVSD